MRLLRVLHSQDIDHRRYVWEVIRIHTLYVYIEMPHPRLLPVGFRFDGMACSGLSIWIWKMSGQDGIMRKPCCKSGISHTNNHSPGSSHDTECHMELCRATRAHRSTRTLSLFERLFTGRNPMRGYCSQAITHGWLSSYATITRCHWCTSCVRVYWRRRRK